MRPLPKLLCSAAAALFAFSITANATTITLIGSSTSYPGSTGTGSGFYPASDAVDTGADRLVTDFASNGGGAGTYLDFSISGGNASHINVYDRTTSGGGNGTFHGGTSDFTTEFELIFSNVRDFSTTVATYDFLKTTPTNPTDPSSFLFSANFAPVSAGFVRYEVVAANGVNPGVADISITGTPEPSSLMLLGTGVLGMAGMARRRFSSK